MRRLNPAHRLVAAIWGLLLVGCATPDHREVSLSERYPPHQVRTNHADAARYFGVFNFNGSIVLAADKDVKWDDVEIFHWFQQAARAGDVFAQYELGHMYRLGCWVTKDGAEAVKWFRAAARHEPLSDREEEREVSSWAEAACERLAIMYEEGIDIMKDPSAAAYWTTKAEAFRKTASPPDDRKK